MSMPNAMSAQFPLAQDHTQHYGRPPVEPPQSQRGISVHGPAHGYGPAQSYVPQPPMSGHHHIPPAPHSHVQAVAAPAAPAPPPAELISALSNLVTVLSKHYPPAGAAPMAAPAKGPPQMPSVHLRCFATWLVIFPLATAGLKVLIPLTPHWPVVAKVFALSIVLVPSAVYVLVPKLLGIMMWFKKKLA